MTEAAKAAGISDETIRLALSPGIEETIAWRQARAQRTARAIEDVFCEELIVAGYWRNHRDLHLKTRQYEISRPRMVCAWLIRFYLNTSYPDLAKYFGGFDHTSLMHGVGNVAKAIEHAPALGVARDATMKRFEDEAVKAETNNPFKSPSADGSAVDGALPPA